MTFYMMRHNMTKLMLPLSLQNGKSALMLASENVHTEIVKYLVDSKSSIDLQSQVVWTSDPKFHISELYTHDKHDKGILYMIILFIHIHCRFHNFMVDTAVYKIPHVK